MPRICCSYARLYQQASLIFNGSYCLIAAIPSFGISQQTFVASYTIYNTSTLVQEFEVKISSSEHFMLAGTQQVSYS